MWLFFDLPHSIPCGVIFSHRVNLFSNITFVCAAEHSCGVLLNPRRSPIQKWVQSSRLRTEWNRWTWVLANTRLRWLFKLSGLCGERYGPYGWNPNVNNYWVFTSVISMKSISLCCRTTTKWYRFLIWDWWKKCEWKFTYLPTPSNSLLFVFGDAKIGPISEWVSVED